jgi:hypothetical protein
VHRSGQILVVVDQKDSDGVRAGFGFGSGFCV